MSAKRLKADIKKLASKVSEVSYAEVLAFIPAGRLCADLLENVREEHGRSRAPPRPRAQAKLLVQFRERSLARDTRHPADPRAHRLPRNRRSARSECRHITQSNNGFFVSLQMKERREAKPPNPCRREGITAHHFVQIFQGLAWPA